MCVCVCLCEVWLAIIMIFDDIILNVEAMHVVKVAMHAILMKMVKGLLMLKIGIFG